MLVHRAEKQQWEPLPLLPLSTPPRLLLQASVTDRQEETFEVAAALVPQGVLQGHIVLLQVHVFDGLQIILLAKYI